MCLGGAPTKPPGRSLASCRTTSELVRWTGVFVHRQVLCPDSVLGRVSLASMCCLRYIGLGGSLNRRRPAWCRTTRSLLAAGSVSSLRPWSFGSASIAFPSEWLSSRFWLLRLFVLAVFCRAQVASLSSRLVASRSTDAPAAVGAVRSDPMEGLYPAGWVASSSATSTRADSWLVESEARPCCAALCCAGL